MAAPDSGTCTKYQDQPVQLAIAGELRIGGSASLEDMKHRGGPAGGDGPFLLWRQW